MKQQINTYLAKMDKFNKYELKNLKALDYKEKMSNFFELFNHTYSIYTKQEIEKFHEKKLHHLFLSQKLLLTFKYMKYVKK